MTEGGDPVGVLPAGGDPGASGPMIHGNVRPVVAYALAHLGDPYVWGADGPNAFDCSGLTLASYRQIGIRLPHKSALQVRYGRPRRIIYIQPDPGRPLDVRAAEPSHPGPSLRPSAGLAPGPLARRKHGQGKPLGAA